MYITAKQLALGVPKPRHFHTRNLNLQIALKSKIDPEQLLKKFRLNDEILQKVPRVEPIETKKDVREEVIQKVPGASSEAVSGVKIDKKFIKQTTSKAA